MLITNLSPFFPPFFLLAAPVTSAMPAAAPQYRQLCTLALLATGFALVMTVAAVSVYFSSTDDLMVGEIVLGVLTCIWMAGALASQVVLRNYTCTRRSALRACFITMVACLHAFVGVTYWNLHFNDYYWDDDYVERYDDYGVRVPLVLLGLAATSSFFACIVAAIVARRIRFAAQSPLIYVQGVTGGPTTVITQQQYGSMGGYGAAAPGYGAPAPGYGGYAAPPGHYGPPPPAYDAATAYQQPPQQQQQWAAHAGNATPSAPSNADFPQKH